MHLQQSRHLHPRSSVSSAVKFLLPSASLAEARPLTLPRARALCCSGLESKNEVEDENAVVLIGAPRFLHFLTEAATGILVGAMLRNAALAPAPRLSATVVKKSLSRNDFGLDFSVPVRFDCGSSTRY
jgi:hypothetical protein